MAKNITTWIPTEEASQMIGLPPATLTRYATYGTIPVRITRATKKAKPRFAKEDIQVMLDMGVKQRA